MIRKLNFKFFIILHWYSRNSKICIRVLYMKQTWNSLSKFSIWMKLCDFTNSNWWIKLSGIRWSKMMIFSISQLWLNNILIFKFYKIFSLTFKGFLLELFMVLIVVNLCLAIERICYFMHLLPLLLFIFQTVPLCNCSIK